jgi:hypothetical protein
MAALATGGFPPPAAKAETGEFDALATRAANFLYNEFMTKGAQNDEFGVGSYAAYILTHAGVDVAAWVRDGRSLKETVLGFISSDLTSSVPAKRLAQGLLAAKALGREDLAGEVLAALKNKETSSGFDANVFSDVPAYELLGRAGCVSEFVYARDYLLSTQDAVYGYWGSAWGPDFMATAQAVRALGYLDPNKRDILVQQRINLGLAWLKNQEQADGSFVASDWDDPLVNTVEMVATLLAVGKNPSDLKSSAGKSPVDYLRETALNPDGSFGRYKNAMDATWALHGYHLLGARVGPAVVLTPCRAEIQVGKNIQLTAVVCEENAIGRDITQAANWSVRDPDVASVSQGLVTGLKAGSTVVSATYHGLTGSAAVTVAPAGGAGGTPATRTVGVAVVGKSSELLFGPAYVVVSEQDRWGLTALGALEATGLPYRVSQQWEGFVEEIAGQANEGLSGWCYAVNDVMPTVSAHQYILNNGDRVVWFYNHNFSTPVPKWEDLVKLQTAGASPAAEVLKSVENILADLQREKADIGQAVSRLGQIVDQLKESQVTAELKAKLGEAVRLLAAALAKVPKKALAPEKEGEKVSLRIDGEILKDWVGALKGAEMLAEKLKAIGVAEADALVLADLMVEVPADLASQNHLGVVFPADAGRQAAEAGLAFVLCEKEVSLRLPPGALKAVVAAAPDVAQVELSVRRVEAAKADLFEGAYLITKSAFDLEVCGLTSLGKKEKLEVFPENLTIAFSLEGVDLERLDLSRLAVYRKKGAVWEFVGGKLSADRKYFSCQTQRLSLYALADFRKVFEDTEGHWAREAIDLLSRRLIIRGITSDLFAPDEKVTRAQFAALLVRALGMEEESDAQPTFKDVPSAHWGRGAVEAAFRAGLVSGTGQGRFEPERPVTREEMAVMLSRALVKQGLAAKPDASQVDQLLAGYADQSAVSPWAREGLAACLKSGVIKARSAVELAPKGVATRAEAAVAIADLLQLPGQLTH